MLRILATRAPSWAAGQPRFVLQVPGGLADLLDDITVMSATASIVMLGISLVALVAWLAARVLRRRRREAALF